ncbi:MAG: hypothetical protein J07HQX50_00971 [Haloquadratum sp. J07HQX50]|jgi:hypothetical protein|nr:MAG: hypothetical protein J07HQX50_00971 [Haloquadratum sp. J07HQX50]
MKMNEELPADVGSVLTQLLDEAREALKNENKSLFQRILRTVRTVVENKIPIENLKSSLLHGCDRIESLRSAPSENTEVIIAEYLRQMYQRLSTRISTSH